MVRQAFNAIAGALVALVLAVRIADGTFTALVQTWYEPLLVASVLVLVACALLVGVGAVRSGGRWQAVFSIGPAMGAVAIAIPVALGLAFEPAPLDGGSLASTDGNDLAAFSATAGEDDPSRRNVYQWAYAFASDATGELIGLDVNVIGFVHHTAETGEGRFLLARFVVACCVADARGYSLPVQWHSSEALTQDGWVRVIGRVGTDASGQPVVLASSVEEIDAPANPYIYP